MWAGPNPQFDYRMGGVGAVYRSSKVALNALTVGYAQALAADGSFKVNALALGLRATNLNSRAAECGGDPAEAEAQAVIALRLPADGPVGGFFPWEGTVSPLGEMCKRSRCQQFARMRVPSLRVWCEVH